MGKLEAELEVLLAEEKELLYNIEHRLQGRGGRSRLTVKLRDKIIRIGEIREELEAKKKPKRKPKKKDVEVTQDKVEIGKDTPIDT